jgi:hypothetical protein
MAMMLGTLVVQAENSEQPSVAQGCDGEFTRLFDGTTLKGWRSRKSPNPPTRGWVAENGVLTVLPQNDGGGGGGGGDIITEKKFSDFILKFEFRLTAKANSGIKYLFNPDRFGGPTFEYQVFDHAHPDAGKGLGGNRMIASLYDVLPANAEKLLKAPGKWNQGMIVVRGVRIEHWLNMRKVLEFKRDSEAFRKAVAASKFRKHQNWGTQDKGHILIQDHNDRVSYRNILIKEL